MAGETILIVDDTPTNLQVLLDALEGAGYEVLGATDGEQALERAVLGHPDLILLDVVMPGVDGFETCRRLKRDAALVEIPVIFMTALSETADKLAGFDAGGVDYLTKPLDHDEVLARVRTHLELRRLQRALAAQNAQLGAVTDALTGFLQSGERDAAYGLLLDAAVQRSEGDYAVLAREEPGENGTTALRVAVRLAHREPGAVLPPLIGALARAAGEGTAGEISRTDLDAALGFATGSLRTSALGPGASELTAAAPARGLIEPHAVAVPVDAAKASAGVLLVGRAEGGFTSDAVEALEQLARTASIVDACEIIRRREAESERGRQRAIDELLYLREEIEDAHPFHDLVGESPALRAVFDQIERVAPTDSTVLIRGETGTGKELVARALHDRSPRREHPLVKVNCAAMPRDLVESELFGHEKGAFTGATGLRKGRFELAHGGTLLLDEIGDMPLETQAKLLRVLQERAFERVGGSATIEVDVRVLAATHRDLRVLVAEGRFREDLFYRLNVFPIDIPPLRGRREDIPALVESFVRRFAGRLGVGVTGVSSAAIDRLRAYAWPGNVRELENVVERAVILSNGESLEIPAGLLPDGDAGSDPRPEPAPTAASTVEDFGAPLAGTLDDVQRRCIVYALDATGWRIEGPDGAARRLGINPSTLRNRMSKLGIRKRTISD